MDTLLIKPFLVLLGILLLMSIISIVYNHNRCKGCRTKYKAKEKILSGDHCRKCWQEVFQDWLKTEDRRENVKRSF